MAAGRSIVASDIHGYKNVVQRNISALLVEPKDADALAAGLEKLIEHPEMRARMGEAGIARATDYDWEHVTQRLAEVYEDVVARHRRDAPARRDAREPLPIDYGVR
jgi:phosphatidylinositol alpha-mannosyltransferase